MQCLHLFPEGGVVWNVPVWDNVVNCVYISPHSNTQVFLIIVIREGGMSKLHVYCSPPHLSGHVMQSLIGRGISGYDRARVAHNVLGLSVGPSAALQPRAYQIKVSRSPKSSSSTLTTQSVDAGNGVWVGWGLPLGYS